MPYAYTVQFRSYSKKTVNQLCSYSTVLGAAIRCKPYSEIIVEIGTHLKTVKITLNIGICSVKVKAIYRLPSISSLADEIP